MADIEIVFSQHVMDQMVDRGTSEEEMSQGSGVASTLLTGGIPKKVGHFKITQSAWSIAQSVKIWGDLGSGITN